MRLLPLFVFLAACDALPLAGWSISEHPCFGNRTDTLWLDDADTAWVGCGSTTSGYGLYLSTNGGGSWAAPTTDPAGYFDDFRVSSVSRSADGLLYVAGTGSGDRVVSLDTASTPMTVSTAFESMGQTWNSFHVGTFRRAPDGFAVAESLTGADLAWRQGDDASWQDGYGWWTSGSSFQILDLDELDGDFYGVGSTITQPPHVFVPAEGSGFAMDPVALDEGSTGELWGLDADAGGFVAGGVDQERDVGVVFTTSGDPADPGAWTLLDVSTVAGTDATWIRGVCRDGDRVVAVGEYSRTSDGLVLSSTDGGATWADQTPLESPPLHRCAFAGGTLAIAGAEGFFARR